MVDGGVQTDVEEFLPQMVWKRRMAGATVCWCPFAGGRHTAPRSAAALCKHSLLAQPLHRQAVWIGCTLSVLRFGSPATEEVSIMSSKSLGDLVKAGSAPAAGDGSGRGRAAEPSASIRPRGRRASSTSPTRPRLRSRAVP